MEPVCRPPTSVNNYQSSQRNIPEERRFRVLSRADQQNKLAPVFVVTTAPRASFHGTCLCGGSKESHAVVKCWLNFLLKVKGKVIPLEVRCGPEGG